MRIILSFILILTLSCFLTAQDAHQLLRKGDKMYDSQDFALAEEHYRKANEQEKSFKTRYNTGNAIYEQNRYEEAVSFFEEAANSSGAGEQKANAYYNLGNAHIKNQNLEEGIEAYKQALRDNPNDDEAKRNLFLAKLMEKQQQQEQQQQEQQEQQDQNQDQENQDQQEQEQDQNQDQENQDQQNSSDNDQSQEGEEQPAGEAQKLSKEDAAKLLQVIENEEKKVQEKLRKISGNKKKPDKDW